jgi:hypothetical protein
VNLTEIAGARDTIRTARAQSGRPEIKLITVQHARILRAIERRDPEGGGTVDNKAAQKATTAPLFAGAGSPGSPHFVLIVRAPCMIFPCPIAGKKDEHFL